MWNDLTMQQRADVISMAVKAGMRDMKSIKSFYDETSRSRRFEDGGSTKDNTPGMTGMMKATLATAAHFGNPTARRMTNYDTRSYTWPNEYIEDGIFMEPKRGNVYVASYDNLVTPQIQDTGRGLSLVEDVWSPENERRSYSQSLKFNNEEDARYFGKHYKEVAPMMHLYADGGIKKYTGDSEDIGYDANSMRFYEKATGKELGDSAILDEVIVNGRNRVKDYLTEANDNTSVYNVPHREYNLHLKDRAEQGAREAAIWREEHPTMSAWGDAAASVPLAVASVPLIAGGTEALAGTSAGQAISSGLLSLSNFSKGYTIAGTPAWAWADAGLTSAFGAHGANEIAKGNVTPEALMEVAPLGQLAKPLYKGVLKPRMRLYNSPLTGNWTKIGNKEYRINPNTLGANGIPIESREIVATSKIPQITSENVASMTPELDAAYKAAVESGNRPEALRLLEQAYLRSGIPKTDITVTPEGHAVGWYHGSEWGNHTIFDSSAMNATIGGTSAHGRIKGNFLTTDVPSAMRYAGSSRYSSADVPDYTSPTTFGEKIKKLFGRYKPRRLYPAERVMNLAPKPKRLFDTEGKAPIEHLEKTDNVVYPMYVNPGEDVMMLDFQGNPWSKSPVIFPNNFYLNRHIRDDIVKTYRDEIIPYNDYEAAHRAWMEDPINIRHGSTSLDKKYFDDGTRSIEGFNSSPRYERVRLVEELVPNTTNGAVQTAAKEGKTSVLMRNVIDSNGGPEGVGYAIDDFVTLKPNQQKLADITYDDNGKLIPLSQRFNWFKDDIRYGLLPFGIGLTGLGLVNEE